MELYGNVLMVSPKFAADRPEAVQRLHPRLPRAATTATASVIKRNLGMARHVEGD